MFWERTEFIEPKKATNIPYLPLPLQLPGTTGLEERGKKGRKGTGREREGKVKGKVTETQRPVYRSSRATPSLIVPTCAPQKLQDGLCKGSLPNRPLIATLLGLPSALLMLYLKPFLLSKGLRPPPLLVFLSLDLSSGDSWCAARHTSRLIAVRDPQSNQK